MAGNRLIPRDRADKFGTITAFVLILLVKFNYASTMYHEWTEGNTFYSVVMFSLGCFVLFNVLSNMYKAIKVDTSIDSIELTNVLLVDWRYCSACEQNAPPRAYHCLTCDKCILKRHSHCMFLGKCVGHKNFRFYMYFILFVWLACLLNNIANFNYYIATMSEYGLKSLLILFMPLIALATGLISIFQFLFIFANSICLILFLLLFFYFGVNFQMILRGQTWHERTKQITIYNLTPKDNFIEVFGYNWLTALFNPFASIKLPSDGTKFRKQMSEQNYNQNFDQNSMSNPYFQDSNNLSKRRVI